jgi:2-oxoglutarate dehydrogenase E2 component (dihydrolipoamide succinyltransferase)
MAAEINLPKLGVSMTEATLVEWVAEDMSAVTEGQVICRIETDKVDQEIEAPVAGTLLHGGPAGRVYEVGELIAEII